MLYATSLPWIFKLRKWMRLQKMGHFRIGPYKMRLYEMSLFNILDRKILSEIITYHMSFSMSLLRWICHSSLLKLKLILKLILKLMPGHSAPGKTKFPTACL